MRTCDVTRYKAVLQRNVCICGCHGNNRFEWGDVLHHGAMVHVVSEVRRVVVLVGHHHFYQDAGRQLDVPTMVCGHHVKPVDSGGLAVSLPHRGDPATLSVNGEHLSDVRQGVIRQGL